MYVFCLFLPFLLYLTSAINLSFMQPNTSNQKHSFPTVETAVPVFIGYTKSAKRDKKGDLHLQAVAIDSLTDYERYFGKAQAEADIHVEILNGKIQLLSKQFISPVYNMYYALQAFFANGGARCYIVSVGGYQQPNNVELADFQAGVQVIRAVQDITLLVFPDAISLPSAVAYYTLYNDVLWHCKEMGNRFALMDVWSASDQSFSDITALRSLLTPEITFLKNGAAYYPNLEMDIPCQYTDNSVSVTVEGEKLSLALLRFKHPALYKPIKNALQSQLKIILPPSPCVAGVYAKMDRTLGVWKAPANVAIALAIKPVVSINNQDQDLLNVDTNTGKSVNAIRTFTGKGVLVWGARTLAGNDNEWRYVPVRRFFLWVEASVSIITQAFVFEPNDANTWRQVKNEITDFLIEQWRNGALQGSKPEQAFFIKVGLGETMTTLDIAEHKMIVELGMAVVRPAEFTILRVVQQMPTP